MRYPQFRKQHLFVGSGVIEAGCKTVIGSRRKQSRMFWTVCGANAIWPYAAVTLTAVSKITGRHDVRPNFNFYVAHARPGSGLCPVTFGQIFLRSRPDKSSGLFLRLRPINPRRRYLKQASEPDTPAAERIFRYTLQPEILRCDLCLPQC